MVEASVIVLSGSVFGCSTHRSRVPARTIILESRRGPLDGTRPGNWGTDDHGDFEREVTVLDGGRKSVTKNRSFFFFFNGPANVLSKRENGIE